MSKLDEYRIVATRGYDAKTLVIPVEDYAAGQHWLASWSKGEDEGAIATARLEHRTLTPWTSTALGGAA